MSSKGKECPQTNGARRNGPSTSSPVSGPPRFRRSTPTLDSSASRGMGGVNVSRGKTVAAFRRVDVDRCCGATDNPITFCVPMHSSRTPTRARQFRQESVIAPLCAGRIFLIVVVSTLRQSRWRRMSRVVSLCRNNTEARRTKLQTCVLTLRHSRLNIHTQRRTNPNRVHSIVKARYQVPGMIRVWYSHMIHTGIILYTRLTR